MLLIFPVNTLETVVNSVAINSHPRQPQDFCSEAQAGVQQAGRSVWSWAQEVRLGWYRCGRGTSLGQECHLVAINSYYVTKSTAHPFLQLPLNTFPVCISYAQGTEIKLCIFFIAKIILFFGS